MWGPLAKVGSCLGAAKSETARMHEITRNWEHDLTDDVYKSIRHLFMHATTEVAVTASGTGMATAMPHAASWQTG